MKNSLPRNILFGFLSWFLPLISTILITPFVVRGLGADEYGLYALMLGFISYSFTFGIARAIPKYVAEYRVHNDTQSVREILSATLLFSLILGFGGTILIIIFTPFLVTDVLLINANQQAEAVNAFYIVGLTIVAVMIQQVFSAVLQAVGRYDWLSHITTLTSTLLSVGNLILVLNGGRAVTLLWWNLLIVAAGGAAFYLAGRRLLPEAGFGLAFNRQILWLVAKFSGGVIGYQIFGNILLLFERSVITRRLGIESLTYYVIPMSLAIYILVFVSSFASVLVPLVSEVHTKGEPARLLSLYLRASKYIGFLVVFMCLATIIGGRAFLSLWLGADFAERSATVLMFHVITWGAMSFSIVSWQITEGIGRPSRNAWLGFSWLVIGAALMPVLISLYGLNGAAAARMSGVAATIPAFVLIIEKLSFGKVQWIFWRKIVLSLTVSGIAAGIVQHLFLERFSGGWFNLVAAITVSGLTYCGILLLLNFFSREEKAWFQQFLLKAVAVR